MRKYITTLTIRHIIILIILIVLKVIIHHKIGFLHRGGRNI